jgi:hypothetical protein
VRRGTGLLLGVPLGWIAMVALNYGTDKLYRSVQLAHRGSTSYSVLLLIIAAVALGAILTSRSPLGAGAAIGAGAVMTLFGVLMQIAPVKDAADIADLFTLGGKPVRGIPLWDGTALFLGVLLLTVGVRRWRTAGMPSYAGGPHGPNAVPTVFGGPKS